MKKLPWQKKANARAQQIGDEFAKLVRLYEYELSNASKNMVARRINSTFTTNVARRRNRLLAGYGRTRSNNSRSNRSNTSRNSGNSGRNSRSGNSSNGSNSSWRYNSRNNWRYNTRNNSRYSLPSNLKNTRYAARSTNERRVN